MKFWSPLSWTLPRLVRPMVKLPVLGVDVAVGVAVLVAVGVAVLVAVGVGVLVAVGAAVLVAVGVAVLVAVGVAVGGCPVSPKAWIRSVPTKTVPRLIVGWLYFPPTLSW